MKRQQPELEQSEPCNFFADQELTKIELIEGEAPTAVGALPYTGECQEEDRGSLMLPHQGKFVFSDIQKSIEMLRAVHPPSFPDSFVDFLYRKTFEMEQRQTTKSNINYTEKPIYKTSKRTLINTQTPSNTSRPKKPTSYQLNILPSNMPPPVEVAPSFIAYLSNAPNARPPDQQPILNYTHHLRTVISTFYARLEELVHTIDSFSFVKLSREEHHSMQEAIIHGKNKFRSYHLKMLVKCMRALLEVEGAEPITQEEAMEMYSDIHSKLRLKHKKKRAVVSSPEDVEMPPCFFDLHLPPPPPPKETVRKGPVRSKFELLHSFDQEKESTLLECYRRTSSFARIRDFFMIRYPDIAHQVTVPSLRCQFNKMIRASIRRLVAQVKQSPVPLPQLDELVDNRIKMLQYFRDGREIRVKMVEYYMRKNYDAKAISEMIHAVNAYIRHVETTDTNQEEEDEEGGERKNMMAKLSRQTRKRDDRKQKEKVMLDQVMGRGRYGKKDGLEHEQMVDFE